jgi:hypothetical protein
LSGFRFFILPLSATKLQELGTRRRPSPWQKPESKWFLQKEIRITQIEALEKGFPALARQAILLHYLDTSKQKTGRKVKAAVFGSASRPRQFPTR